MGLRLFPSPPHVEAAVVKAHIGSVWTDTFFPWTNAYQYSCVLGQM